VADNPPQDDRPLRRVPVRRAARAVPRRVADRVEGAVDRAILQEVQRSPAPATDH
jgi:hypothetical protein